MTGNTGKHAAVNSLEMYYEIHGEGTRTRARLPEQGRRRPGAAGC